MELGHDLNTPLFGRKPPGHRDEPHDVPRLLPSDFALASSSVVHGASPNGKPTKMARRSSSPAGASGLDGIKWEAPVSGRRSSHVRSPMASVRGGVVKPKGSPLARKPFVADDGTEPPPRKPRRRCWSFPTRTHTSCFVLNTNLSCSVSGSPRGLEALRSFEAFRDNPLSNDRTQNR